MVPPTWPSSSAWPSMSLALIQTPKPPCAPSSNAQDGMTASYSTCSATCDSPGLTGEVARRAGRGKPQSRYVQVSDLKFSRGACVVSPLRPLQGYLARVTGRLMTCVHAVAASLGRKDSALPSPIGACMMTPTNKEYEP